MVKTKAKKIVVKAKTAPKTKGRRIYTTRWNKAQNVMTCKQCGESWTPKFQDDGKRLIKGSWLCPKGCCK